MIELPRDAEGREIPLNTKRLYDAGGVPVSIRAFRYNPNECFWRVERLDGLGTPMTTALRFTQPDSWEKLEEDLDRCIKADSLCAYNPSQECSACILPRDSQFHCDSLALKEIKERIRKLRGEGE